MGSSTKHVQQTESIFRVQRLNHRFHNISGIKQVNQGNSCPRLVLQETLLCRLSGFTCRGEDQWEQGEVASGGQDQEYPSILFALNGHDAAGGNTDGQFSAAVRINCSLLD